MQEPSSLPPASGSLQLLRAAVRYRMVTGLRRTLSFWTAIMSAGVVAASLEAAPPIRRWMDAWAAGGSRLHVGTALLILIAGTTLFLPLIHGAMRGAGDEAMRLLPLSSRMRFGADLAAVTLFDAVPAAMFTFFVVGAAPGRGRAVHDGLMAVVLFAGMAILQTAGLDGRRRRDRALIWFLVVVCGTVAFARNVEPFAGAMAALFLLGTACDAAASSEIIPRDASTLPRPRLRRTASGGGLLRNEIRTLWRGGESRLVWSMAWGAALVLAGWLAARNNSAQSNPSLARIAALFGSLAVCAVVVEVARARRAMLPFRELEAILPTTAVRRMAAGALAAGFFLAVVPLVTLLSWRGAPAYLLVVLALEVILCLLLLAAAEGELVTGGSGEVPVIAWGVAAAVGGAISPIAAAAALALAASIQVRLLYRLVAETDVISREEE